MAEHVGAHGGDRRPALFRQLGEELGDRLGFGTGLALQAHPFPTSASNSALRRSPCSSTAWRARSFMRRSSAIAVRSVFNTSAVRPSSAYARARFKCVSAKSGFAPIDRWYTFTASSKRPSFASDAPIPESAAKADRK